MYPIEILVTKTQERKIIKCKEHLPKDLAFHVISITKTPDRRDINHRYVDEHPHLKNKRHHEGRPSDRNKENFLAEDSVEVTRR